MMSNYSNDSLDDKETELPQNDNKMNLLIATDEQQPPSTFLIKGRDVLRIYFSGTH